MGKAKKLCRSSSVRGCITPWRKHVEEVLEGKERIFMFTLLLLLLLFLTAVECGPGSSVGIANDYGLDGPGSNPGADEIFRPSRPALRATQPPAKWVSGLSRG